MPGGPMMASQLSPSKAMPFSAKVGRSGRAGERFDEATPSARTLPAWICGSAVLTLTAVSCTSPASRACTAGARAVLHHDLLADTLREFLRQDAAERVGVAAGRVRHDQLDRPGREGGR